ncbi:MULTISPECIES: hypothetical protein, partial [unclassified Pseudomonas]|uniref:hypothetical protein n=2 Tax=unclassified Pseudomonas TaxID=196821 RepID=UPI001F1B2E32
MMGVPTQFYPITEWTPAQFPIFFGEGIPGQPVTICQSNTGLVVAQTTVDGNGNWLTQSHVALPLGPYSVTAYYDLSQGYAPNLPFHVGSPSQIAGNGPSQSDNSPVLTSLTIVDSLRPWLTGTAPPNATVVIAHSGGSVYYASVGADSNGYWEATPATDLVVDANNWVDLALIANDAEGNALSPWVGVQLTVLLTGSAGSVLPPGSPPRITSSTTVDSLRPLLTGKAPANANVTVYQYYGAQLGKTFADANGDWSMPLTLDLTVDPSTKQSRISLGLLDANGQPGSWAEDVFLTVNLASGGSALPPGSPPKLTSSSTVTSLLPTLQGKAPANANVTVYQYYGAQLGKTFADANGDWSMPLTLDLTVDP